MNSADIAQPNLRQRVEFPPIIIGLAAIALLAWLAMASREHSASQLLATAMVALFGIGCTVWVACDRRFEHTPAYAILLLLCATRIAAMFVAPLLEDDHFRYLWDGYISATTGQPFAHAPSHYFDDTRVPGTMQSALNGINHPELPTIYGPLLQVLFALSYGIAPGALWPFKLMLLGAEIATVLLLRSANVAPKWLLVYALHPLVLKESAITAHPDLLIGALLLGAALAWVRAREALAAALVCAAIAMKLSALVVLPLFLLSRHGKLSVLASTSALVGLTLIAVASFFGGGGELQALAAFGQQWTFNPLLFRFAALAMGDGAARIAVAAAFVFIAIAVALRWWMRLRRSEPNEHMPLPPVLALFSALLLLSPAVNPWYWLWLFPLAIVDRQTVVSRIALVAASASMLAYAHVATQVAAQSSITTFVVPWWATLAQVSIIAFAALWMMYPRTRPLSSTLW